MDGELWIKIPIGPKFEDEWKHLFHLIMTFSKINNSSEKNYNVFVIVLLLTLVVMEVGFVRERLKESAIYFC